MKRAAYPQSDTRPNQCVPHRLTLNDTHVTRVITHANGQCLQDFGDIFEIPLGEDAAVAVLSDDFTLLLIRTDRHLYCMRDRGVRMICAGESGTSVMKRANKYAAFRIPLDGFQNEWHTIPFDRLNGVLFCAGIKALCTSNGFAIGNLCEPPQKRPTGCITHYHHASSETVISIRFSYTRNDLEVHQDKVCCTLMYLCHLFEMHGVPSGDIIPLIFGGYNWRHWVLQYEAAENDINMELNNSLFKRLSSMMD
jgi:hypothetical protein